MRNILSSFLLLLLAALAAAQSSAAPESSVEPSSTAAASSAAGTSASVPPTSGSDSGSGSSSSSPSSTSSSRPSNTSSSKPSATATATASIPNPSSTSYGPKGSKGPPDVLLRVPQLHVGRISLDVDNLLAEVALAASVANSLVTLNAGIQVGIDKVNITISDVDANLDLVIRLGNLVKVVNRTLSTLDLNPALINLIDGAVDAVDGVIGAVDGLLGSIVQGDSKVNFLIDNLGNIVQEVVGSGKSTIVGSYAKNMTFITGTIKDLGKGLTQKTYRYEALGSLVNVVTNALGQVVQAVVVGAGGGGGGGGGGGSSSSSAVPSSTAKPTSSTATASVVPTETSTA